MNYLKPLGLSILLNTCNISTEEKYTNFFNHLVCESIKVREGLCRIFCALVVFTTKSM